MKLDILNADLKSITITADQIRDHGDFYFFTEKNKVSYRIKPVFPCVMIFDLDKEGCNYSQDQVNELFDYLTKNAKGLVLEFNSDF